MYKQRLRISHVTYRYFSPMLLNCHGALHGRCLLNYFFYPRYKSYLTMTGHVYYSLQTNNLTWWKQVWSGCLSKFWVVTSTYLYTHPTTWHVYGITFLLTLSMTFKHDKCKPIQFTWIDMTPARGWSYCSNRLHWQCIPWLNFRSMDLQLDSFIVPTDVSEIERSIESV